MDSTALKTFCTLVDQELQRRKRDLPLLVEGAAFELWLAFEARLVLEHNRHALGVDPEHWTANEFKKVDLGVWEGWENLVTAIEFKMIHNNKNWSNKVDQIWSDLRPERGSDKANLKPTLRASIAAVVGKVYQDPKAYPGQRRDLDKWEAEMWEYMLPTAGQYRGWAARSWSGTRHVFAHDDLIEGVPHFLQLHLILAAT